MVERATLMVTLLMKLVAVSEMTSKLCPVFGTEVAELTCGDDVNLAVVYFSSGIICCKDREVIRLSFQLRLKGNNLICA